MGWGNFNCQPLFQVVLCLLNRELHRPRFIFPSNVEVSSGPKRVLLAWGTAGVAAATCFEKDANNIPLAASGQNVS